MAQVGPDTVITVDGAGRMILEGVEVSRLPAGWIFAACPLRQGVDGG